jgi:protein-S-isoprenylcysteine O-methyltransferase Ste14
MNKRKDNRQTLHNRRKFLSRIVMAALAGLILVTDSKWRGSGVVNGILFLSGALFAGIAAIGRIWCSVYISGYKIKHIVASGPYSLCRNPLYFFSFIGAVGVGMTTGTFIVPAVISVFFALYYPGVIRKEEERLLAVHGDDYIRYRENTPAFIPSFRSFHEPEDHVVKPAILRRRLIDAVWFVWLVGIIGMIRIFHEAGVLPSYFDLY